MRAHDVSIGLAVAWARRAAVTKARRMLPRAREKVVACAADATIIGHCPISWRHEVHLLVRGENAIVDRGPVVEPAPLTDMRVAFGIAMAQHPVQVCWDAGSGVYIDIPGRQIVRRISMRPDEWRSWCVGCGPSEDIYP